MSYCINPFCTQRHNSDDAEQCATCGTPLLMNGRIRLIRPLRPLDRDPDCYTEVFLVDDLGSRWHPVRETRVMKILKWKEPKMIELMRREVLALQVINHPGVPNSTWDDYFIFPLENSSLELHCLVMQYFEGKNLESWLKDYGKISQKLALDWLKQLVSILDTVHRSTFFHRDIKPENIIVQDNSKLALVDFGGARQITDTFLLKVGINGGTSTGLGSERKYKTTILGTPGYSPLEQINGQAVIQSDFYALGRTFVYLVTGISVIKFKTDEFTGRLIWRHKAPHIDKPFAKLLDDMMAPFPGERPQNAQAILQRLERLPLQSKLNRIVKSKPFQFSAFILILLCSFGIYNTSSLPWVSKVWLSNYFLSQGKKAEFENRFTDAQKNFTTAIKLNKSVTYQISAFYFEQASRNLPRPEVAKKYYQLTIKFNPQDADSYNNLALVCQQLSDLKCVERSYSSALKLKPNSWEIHYSLGSFYDDQGKYSLAVQQYQLGIKKGGNASVGAINNLSRLENRNGEYIKAELLAQQGLQKTSDTMMQAALYKNLGWSLFEQKLYVEAKNNLEKSIELDPQRADGYCLLAQTQEVLGELDSAKLSWETCLILNSSQPEVQQWRQQVLQRLSKIW
ncbi:4-Cys prefix domain-containing protein [Pelatocladus sp. BLCC-F211]|uniref:protein kinase domain-containing protein n=1 Tax=Pelatocladus sp. BLCC-F211 TaxID=3342752 RepID=UPI0035BA6C9D